MWEVTLDTAAPGAAKEEANKVNGKVTISDEKIPMDGAFKFVGGAMMLVLAWVVLGIGAFIMSLVCIAKGAKAHSSGSENVIGLLLALLLGPFYWIYFLASSTYCKAVPPTRAGGAR
jgi:hypothetical protein